MKATCSHCGGMEIEMRRTVNQNGRVQVGPYCRGCGRRPFPGRPFVSASQFTPEQIAAMPLAEDYRNPDLTCAVCGCERSDVEWNHYAPRALFGSEADRWPAGWLCTDHHEEWHKRTRTGSYAPRSIKEVAESMVTNCPKCKTRLAATAIVDAFCEPPNWAFWGQEGQRGIRCQSPAYVHFRVTVNGREQHRLAIIKAQATEWLTTQEAALEDNRERGVIR